MGEKRRSFPVKGSNWFKRPEGKATKEGWRGDIKLLEQMHEQMVDAIKQLRADDLSKISRGRSNRAVIFGIAAHDIYHAGQIQLLKRLAAQ